MKHFVLIVSAALLLLCCFQSKQQDKLLPALDEVTCADTLVLNNQLNDCKNFYSKKIDNTQGDNTAFTISSVPTNEIVRYYYPTYRNFLDNGEQDIVVYDSQEGSWVTVYKTSALTNPVIVNMSFLVSEKDRVDSVRIIQMVDTLRQILLTPNTNQTHWITLPPSKRE